MTPKEKAEEIYNKMYKIQDNDGIFVMFHDMAIQCALIAVAEIKKTTTDLEFWNEVENELNKL
jgi:hypothetical protein